MLRDWKEAEKPEFIPCDLDALDNRILTKQYGHAFH
jgi:hypothetical protein